MKDWLQECIKLLVGLAIVLIAIFTFTEEVRAKELTVVEIPDAPVPAGQDAVEDNIPALLEVIETPEVEISCLRCTGYTGEQGYSGLTASGTQVCEGTLAGPAEWLGRECDLYDMEGNLLGTYTFLDTGNPKYVNSERIDMWFATNAELRNFQKTVGDYVNLVWR